MIQVESATRIYGSLTAVDDVSFSVERDELVGFVVDIFTDLGLIAQFKIPFLTINNFFTAKKLSWPNCFCPCFSINCEV